jgi:ribonuclease E
MADKMLIDAAHPEETRVVVLRGNRVEEFDFESANRKQLRGNIYLAKVTRVEPSLQAAFVDYGGNRHGFLAFSEIHPDYYQIPVADRQALIAQEERDQRAADDEADKRAGWRGRGRHRHRGAGRRRDVKRSGPIEEDAAAPEAAAADAGLSTPTPDEIAETTGAPGTPEPMAADSEFAPDQQAQEAADEGAVAAAVDESAFEERPDETAAETSAEQRAEPQSAATPETGEAPAETGDHAPAEAAPEQAATEAEPANGEEHSEEEAVESVGGADALEEVQERMPRFRRQYKIQEVIKRRQVMLVQVVKEERGTKGAALTTYLSLAGRYSVLMPNTARGGGISRKITSADDRNRLKEIAQELEVPEGMGVILRTAGASRTKTEVKRDFEYLLRLWETVRDLTLKSTAPKLVYEEGSLVKRSIRDLYSKDIDEIIVAGEEAHKEAREFMRMLMPSHVKHVKLYKDTQPLFTHYGIESQLDAMFSPVVQLRSGGYIVINQAEALVAIDVNSGRATREHHIEDTALKTNIEAAEEIARQLRLRDLAGLVVIDFIDMDEPRNNRNVERRLKDALKHDRARIQVGRISHFGLMEMSRQRIRSSVLESSTEKCPVCGGSGHVRSVSSVALQALRALEETLIKGATHNLIVRTRSEVALYMLNHKRAHLRELEERFRVTLTISADPTVSGQQSYIVDRGEQVHSVEDAKSLAASTRIDMPAEDESEAESVEETEVPEAQDEAVADAGEREGGRHRRRRGRGRGRGGPREHSVPGGESAADEGREMDAPQPSDAGVAARPPGAMMAAEGEQREGGRRRRRGRRGGRRNRRRNGNGEQPFAANDGVRETPMQHAAEDFERSPEALQTGRDFPPVSEEDADAVAPAFDAGNAAAPSADEPASAPPPSDDASEPQRRRSTVREPASFTGEGAPAPAPTLPPPRPVISSTREEGGAPKRGWWAKRLMGDKD